MRICVGCGAILDQDEGHCRKCGRASSSRAAQCSTAREPEMMWVCGTWGVGVDFLTHSTEIAMAWKNENEWHSAHQKPVRSNAGAH